MDKIKKNLGQGKVSNTSTYNVLQSVFDYYLEHNSPVTHDTDTEELPVPSYQHVDFEGSLNDDIFLCSSSSIDNLIQRVTNHARQCDKKLHIKDNTTMRHAVRQNISCESEHSLIWYSSPHLDGGKLLVNLKMAHGLFTSGILPEHYEKFCTAAGIGFLGDAYLATIQPDYCELVNELAGKSEEQALRLEIAMSVGSELNGGIGIMTDARHCWRRNAQFSDIVCIGDLSHKVLRVETISKDEDPCSQRHELAGVDKIYKYLDENDCPVLIHAHDNNSSVTKYVRERGDTENANDTWHLTKGIAKGAKKIAGGSKKTHGIDWHWELKDKAASIKTHIFWCMKNCQGNAETLRCSINNILSHYKGDHSMCHETSRCRLETNYIPTKTEIKDSAAEKILRSFFRNCLCTDRLKCTHCARTPIMLSHLIMRYFNMWTIPVRSHTFVEIDHEIISTAILLLPLNHSRRVVVSYKRKYVHEVLVNRLFKLAQEKVWLGELTVPQ